MCSWAPRYGRRSCDLIDQQYLGYLRRARSADRVSWNGRGLSAAARLCKRLVRSPTGHSSRPDLVRLVYCGGDLAGRLRAANRQNWLAHHLSRLRRRVVVGRYPVGSFLTPPCSRVSARDIRRCRDENADCRASARAPTKYGLGILCVAAFCCCIPVAIPQTHLVAFCGDIGLGGATRATMLSVMSGAWRLVAGSLAVSSIVLVITYQPSARALCSISPTSH
jgi:hypothetical protein